MQPNGAERVSYEDYLKGVLIKLSRDGFEIERNIKIGNYDVDVFAISPTFEPSPGFMYDSLELLLGKHPYRLAIIVARMPAVAIANCYSCKPPYQSRTLGSFSVDLLTATARARTLAKSL